MHALRGRFEKSRSEDRSSSIAKTIYVFRCGESGLYAFTTDSKGRILPSRLYPQVHWRFERSVTLQFDNTLPRGKALRTTLGAIAKYGYLQTHAAIDAELFAFTNSCI